MYSPIHAGDFVSTGSRESQDGCGPHLTCITDGDLRIGDQLPTEDSLIARFGVSRITVRRAIQNLVSRGLVEIRRGKGTFVAAPKITQELTELSGFVEDMHALGRQPKTRVIGKEIVTANATVASQLALTKGERVVRIPYRRQNSLSIQSATDLLHVEMVQGHASSTSGVPLRQFKRY